MEDKNIAYIGIDESANHNLKLPIFIVSVRSWDKQNSLITDRETIRETRKELESEKDHYPYIGDDFRFVLIEPEEREDKHYRVLWDFGVESLIRSYTSEFEKKGYIVEPHIDGLMELLNSEFYDEQIQNGTLDRISFHPKSGTSPYPKVPVIAEAHTICGRFKTNYLIQTGQKQGPCIEYECHLMYLDHRIELDWSELEERDREYRISRAA